MTETRDRSFVYYPETDGEPMTESDVTRDYLLYCVEVLQLFFQSRRNIYVSGNLFIYYREGDPEAVISPDVFVIFGVSNRKRRTYKAWQEGGKLPSFIIEITSLTTRKWDEVEKPQLYASLGVQEYFQYDPTGDYLHPQLKGSRLVNGQYQPLPLDTRPDGTPFIRSSVLGLDLILQTPTVPSPMLPGLAPLPLELRFYDPQTDQKLLNFREMDTALQQAEQNRIEAEQAREQAEQARRGAIARLLGMGLTAEQVAEALGFTVDEVLEQC